MPGPVSVKRIETPSAFGATAMLNQLLRSRLECPLAVLRQIQQNLHQTVAVRLH